MNSRHPINNHTTKRSQSWFRVRGSSRPGLLILRLRPWQVSTRIWLTLFDWTQTRYKTSKVLAMSVKSLTWVLLYLESRSATPGRQIDLKAAKISLQCWRPKQRKCSPLKAPHKKSPPQSRCVLVLWTCQKKLRLLLCLQQVFWGLDKWRLFKKYPWRALNVWELNEEIITRNK